MKFSHSLQLNSYPEWVSQYINYSNLKKLIYSIEKTTITKNQSSNLSPEYSSLTLDHDFITSLDNELLKITSFYQTTQNSLEHDISDLQELVFGSISLMDDSLQNDYILNIERTLSQPPQSLNSNYNNQSSSPLIQNPNNMHLRTTSEPNLMSNDRKHGKTSLIKQAIELFILLSNLKQYSELNYQGFNKILKKYEKVTGNPLKNEYMSKVDVAIPFLESSSSNLDRWISLVIDIYATLATQNDIQVAKDKLVAHLHERVVFSRNTIWKDMVEFERKNESVGLLMVTLNDSEQSLLSYTKVSIQGFIFHVPIIPLRLWLILLGFLALILIVNFPILGSPEQNNCFGIILFVSYLWALELLPLFVTALLVPFFVVFLRVLRKTLPDENGIPHLVRLHSKDAAKQIFSDMFGPVIMLLLGGFSLAAALSKQNIAKSLAGAVLGRAGNKPMWVLLANMFVATFSSMWISNVAAPVLCFSLVAPILRNLPPKSNYAKALVMGIAMAANVGGMASPISSPQNVIAMGTMHPSPSWLEWFAIAIPICIALDLLIWGLLLLIYKPADGAAIPEMASYSNIGKFNPKQYYVIFITLLTIGLWCVESTIEQYVGDMGVIAILPIVAFFGTGILTKDDWNSMLWSVVVLAMGGISLGKAVDSSGLLHQFTEAITPYLSTLSPFNCLVLFAGIVVVITSFISHTVGALIILPVIAQIGLNLPDPRPRTLVMAAAMMCSGGMGLPVSSFPNMNAISLDGPTGVPWLTVADFLKVGILSSLIALVVVISIGYPIMEILNFH